MSLIGFQKSVRMFRKFSEETQRRRGGNDLGRDGVTALAALERVLDGERLFDGSLLEPLAAFGNLLQSGQLPPEFGDYSFGDALLMIEEAHAKLRENDEQRWEFATELAAPRAARLKELWPAPSAGAADRAHGIALRRFVLDAAQQVEPNLVLVCGALTAPELPLAELCARFQRVLLSDLDLPALQALVQRVVPQEQRARVVLEVYDPTGCYVALTDAIESTIAAATSPEAARQAVVELLSSYDVTAGSAGLTNQEGTPDLAVSAMLLSELGLGFTSCVEGALKSRNWDASLPERAPLSLALALHSRLVEQHHVQALVRRAKSAVLVSAVSQVRLASLPSGQEQAQGEPVDLLAVEHLSERLPRTAEPKAEQSWEQRQPLAGNAKNASLLTLVEAVLV
jgi:hypothetical protein